MRVIILSLVSMIVFVDCQFWKYPQSFLENFAWARKGRTANMQTSQDATATTTTTQRNNETTERIEDFTTLMRLAQTTNLSTIKMKYTTQSFTSATTLLTSSKVDLDKETITPSDIEDDDTSFQDTSTQEEMGTTEEPRDNHRLNDFYLSRREKPQVKIASNISQVSTILSVACIITRNN